MAGKEVAITVVMKVEEHEAEVGGMVEVVEMVEMEVKECNGL